MRDHLLDEPAAFRQIRASLGNHPKARYQFGRVGHVYLSTMSFNLRRRRLFSAASRFLFTIARLTLSGRDVLSREFWRGVKAEHVTDSL